MTWNSTVLAAPPRINPLGFFSTPTSLTSTEGIATVGFTVSVVAGVEYQISAIDPALPGVESSVNILSVAGPVGRYNVSNSVFDPPPGSDIVIYAQAADIYGNPVRVAGRVVNWTQTEPAGELAFTSTPTDANGVAAVTFSVSDMPGTSHRVVATDASGFTGNTGYFGTQNFLNLVFLADGVGPLSTCGLAPDGAVWCWGANDFGGLGIGAMGSDRSLPGRTGAEAGPSSLSAGLYHTCVAAVNSYADCWGGNTNGQLGDNTTQSRQAGGSAQVPDAVSAVTAGHMHACALGQGDQPSAYCWGTNTNGQLGTGSVSSMSTVPLGVAGGLRFATITAGGAHTCGLTPFDRDAYCWGANANGQLGDDTNTDRSAPTLVAGGLKFTALSAGAFNTCGIVDSGAAYCWGTLVTAQKVPTLVPGGHSFVAISAGLYHACGITTASAAWCWGLNVSGELGDGTFNPSASPVPVSGGLQFKSIGAGGAVTQSGSTSQNWAHTCGVTTANITYCWGSNNRGQLGVGLSVVRSNTPLRVSGQE